MSEEIVIGPGKPIQNPPVYVEATLPVDSDQEAVLMAERLDPSDDSAPGPFPERISGAKAKVDQEGNPYVLLTILMININNKWELQEFGKKLMRWWN